MKEKKKTRINPDPRVGLSSEEVDRRLRNWAQLHRMASKLKGIGLDSKAKQC